MKVFLNKLSVIVGVMMFISFLFISCAKDEQVPPPPVTSNGYTSGVFIVNEGPFGNGTGTISFMNRDGSNFTNEIFQLANSMIPLGNLVQSMSVIDDKAYIAVNNANKIEIVMLETFQSVYTIENITSPRYIVEAGDKIYVSCWDNTVKVLSTDGTESFGQIDVGTGPEKMLLNDQKLWVLNQGGLGIDSTISIIDIQTNQVISTIQGFAKPTGIKKGLNGFIWVMCSGEGWNGFPGPDDTEGHLVSIDPDDYSIVQDIAFPSSSEHPEKLEVDNKRNLLFYSYSDGIYKFNMEGNSLETEAFIKRSHMFYGLGFDVIGNVIYTSDPLDYVQNGMVYRYNPDNGNAIDSVNAGIIPGEFFFTDRSD